MTESWKDYAIKEYFEEKRSFHSIGKELGKNPKTIRDAIIKAGLTPRSKSQAQKLVVGRDGPPTKGPRSERTKKKISNSQRRRLEEMPDDEYEQYKDELSQRGKKQWKDKSAEEKRILLQPMLQGARRMAGRGSRTENYIADEIEKLGFAIDRRSKRYTNPYEIDIFFINDNIAVEIDGPMHFSPVFGEESLMKTQARDNIKNTFMINFGFHIIRMRDHTTSFSMAACSRAVEQLLKLLDKIKSKNLSPAINIIDIT